MPDASELKIYLNTLNPNVMAMSWGPQGDWCKVHGDAKSFTGGAFRMRSMFGSDGLYHVKVIGSDGNTVIGPVTVSGDPPTASAAVEAVKAALSAAV
ncbi:hypothetical protein FRC12_005335 [Ceratobasidium sp. 428]|nr:hypothetical protein FRC09_006371 [Ceratobasidium sp. 395]KAG8768826.1 hypothetical protein FRC12_005335 [Ceratobasidium sp. 428]